MRSILVLCVALWTMGGWSAQVGLAHPGTRADGMQVMAPYVAEVLGAYPSTGPRQAASGGGAMYSRLQIAPVQVEYGILLPPEFQDSLSRTLLSELKAGHLFSEVAGLGEAAGAGDLPTLTLAVTVTRFNPGDRDLRRTIGLGAGTTRLNVRARFFDAGTCVTLLETTEIGRVWAGWAGGDSLGAAHKAAKAVAQSARRMDRKVRTDMTAPCPDAAAGPRPGEAPGPPQAEAAGTPTSTLPPDYERRLRVRFDALEAAEMPGLEQRAAAADPEALFLLGLAYVEGRHVSKDGSKGFDLYKESAAQGYRPALVALGEGFLAGTVVPQDYAEAFKWSSAAAAQGSPEAQSNVAVMYLQGFDRPKDARAAVAWLTRAAVQDLPGAQRMLAEAYASGNGVGKDDAAAVKWFQRAAEGGDPVGQVELGVRYTRGWGVPVDDAAAVRWELKAAEQENAEAMLYLGVRHEDGRGVARDAARSVRYFRQAAELGNAVAMCYLGDMYFRGSGTGQSDREAFRWYLTSAAAGFANCQPNLKAAEKRLAKTERNAAEREARAWAAELQDRLKQPRAPSQR